MSIKSKKTVMLTAAVSVFITLTSFMSRFGAFYINNITIAAVLLYIAAKHTASGIKTYFSPKNIVLSLLWSLTFCYLCTQLSVPISALLCVVSFLTTPFIIVGIENFLKSIKSKTADMSVKQPKTAAVIVFMYTLFSLCLFWLLCFPYGDSPDSQNQWAQIHGELSYSDVTAVGHTLFLKLILSVWDNFTAVIIVHILMISLLFAVFAAYFSKKGVPFAPVFFVCALFNSAMMPIEPYFFPWKDTPYVFFMGLLLLVLMQSVSQKRLSLLSYITAGISLSGIFLMRLNGAVTVIFSGLYIFIYALKTTDIKKFLLCAAVFVLSAAGVNFYAYRVLHARHLPNGFSVQVFDTGIAAAMHDGKLTADEYAEIDSILPAQWMYEHYSPQVPLMLVHSRDESPEIAADPDYDYLNNNMILQSGINKTAVIKLYFRLLPRHFAAFAKNAFYGTVVVWGHYNFINKTIWFDNISIIFALIIIVSAQPKGLIRLIHPVFIPLWSNMLSIAVSTVTNESRYLLPTVVLFPFYIIFLNFQLKDQNTAAALFFSKTQIG